MRRKTHPSQPLPRHSRRVRRGGWLATSVVPLAFLVVVLVVWEVLARWRQVPEYLLPTPSQIATVFAEHAASLLKDTGITALEALIGFVLATITSAFVAVVFTYSRPLYNTLMPYLIGLKAVPVVAMAPLLVLWLGNGFVSKAVMAAVICFFPVVVNLTSGLRDVDEDQIELMRSLSASRAQIFWTLRVPHSLPYLFAALKIASTLSVVGAIVAEFSGANSGIGYVILVAALRIDTPLLFCGIVLASLLGLLLYYVIEAVEHRTVFWNENHHGRAGLD